MADIRIFSYLPNPRVYKATITGRLNGVSVEVIGATPPELGTWLWDFDARPLNEEDKSNPDNLVPAKTGFSGDLYKTPEFRVAHPYGTVPAGFSGDGEVGIFESNSIMRSVARAGIESVSLYGSDGMMASRIDGFLDVALLFARDSQIYLLAMGSKTVTTDIFDSMREASLKYLSGIDNAVQNSAFVAGDSLSIADICFACELCLFSREKVAFRQLESIGRTPIWYELEEQFPAALAHFNKLINMPGINEDLGPYMEKVNADLAARQG